MKPFLLLATLLLLAAPIWAQESDGGLPPPIEDADIAVPADTPVRPASPPGSFGMWFGSPTEPLHVRQEWNRVIGDAPIVAFIWATDEVLVTVEGERDKKTRQPDFARLTLRTRVIADAGFAPPVDAAPLAKTLGDNAEPIVSLVAIPAAVPASVRVLCSRRGDTETATLWELAPEKTLVLPKPLAATAPFFPLCIMPSVAPNPLRVLASTRASRVVTADYTASTEPDTAPTLAEPKPIAGISVRVSPVSAACVAPFAGERKPLIIATLGSVNNSPVTFTPIRGRTNLPDTEDEFAPGIIAAWQVAGRKTPLLVTARNIGGEEGADNPEGRVLFSAWNEDENRWQSVWESPSLGKKVCGIAVTNTGKGGATKLTVVYEEASGTARILCLSPLPTRLQEGTEKNR